MACCALALRMAGGAKVRLSCGLHSVLTQEITIVNDMAFGKRDLGLKLHVAPIAVARVPLIFVGVTAETSRVLGSRIVVVDSDIDVASHTVAGTGLGVLPV